MADTRLNDTYDRLKSRLIGFGIRPGERLNEGALARDLNVSRTPLREALNRLRAERLVDFRPGAGFFCRPLEPQAIYDLYELRWVVETGAVALACRRAADADLKAFDLETRTTGLVVNGLSVAEAVSRDEAFHVGIARLSGNAEIAAQLMRINDRIRFIRWINMATRVRTSKNEHRAILAALMRRDADAASGMLAEHIGQRMDQVTDAIREGLSSIYLDGADSLMDRVLEVD